MPLYKCKLRNTDGKLLKVTLNAHDEYHLRQKVDQMGFLLISYKEKKGWKKNRSFQEEFFIFLEQLKVLLKSSVMIDEALQTIIETSAFSPRFSEVLEELKIRVKKGESLSSAFSHYPDFFSPFIVNMVKTGEKSGELPQIFEYIVNFQRQKLSFTKRLFSLFVYPALVITFMFFILIFVSTYIIPKYKVVFENMQIQLPWITNFIFQVSSFLRTYYWYWGGVLLLLVLTFFYLYFFQKRLLLKFLFFLPVTGDFLLQYYQLIIYISLATLLKGGVQLNEAVKLVGEGMEVDSLKENFSYLYQEILKGNSFSNIIELFPHLFPPFFMGIISSGEKTGKLEEVFFNLYSYSLESLERKFETVVQLLEPMIIVGLGLVVGIIVFSLFLPLVSFINQV